MKRGQLAIALLAALAVVGAFLLGGGGSDDDPSSTTARTTPADGDAIVVPFAYSPEKEPLLKPLIEEFNASGRGQSTSRAASRAPGTPRPASPRQPSDLVAWSPASSLWGRLLNFEADRPFAPDDSPSLVRTPLVIAMWEPMAKALGWPKKQIGFSDVLDLATSGEGWAKFGHPEYGAFKLVHTNPDSSTSGLSAVVAEYYAATGKKEGLRESDINGSKAAQDRQRHRALDRPLRRHDAVHRRPDARGGAGLRVGGRDGGGDAAGLQRQARRASRG